jgi:hypothetical protein
MKRRAYLGAVGASAAALSGCVTVRAPQNQSEVAYQVGHSVTYDHEDLTLRPLQERVHLGDAIAFEVINTGDSSASLGCRIPWALQRRSGDDWQHVTWTGDRYYQMCAKSLSPGGSVEVEIELSESGLEAQASDVRGELRPGTYRLLLLGPSPNLTVDFEVQGR